MGIALETVVARDNVGGGAFFGSTGPLKKSSREICRRGEIMADPKMRVKNSGPESGNFSGRPTPPALTPFSIDGGRGRAYTEFFTHSHETSPAPFRRCAPRRMRRRAPAGGGAAEPD